MMLQNLNTINYFDFLNNNLPLIIITGSLTFSIIGVLYISGYIFNNTIDNNDLTNISSDTSGSDTIKTLDTIRRSDTNDSIYDTASQNTDVPIESIEYLDKDVQTMNDIKDINIQTDNVEYLNKDIQTMNDIKDVNIQTENIKFNNELINKIDNLGNQIYESSISYNDKLYNIALDLINKNDELNKLLIKDTIDQGTSPIKAVIDLNHEELLAKIKELLNANTDNNSLINMDALRITFKDYLESVGNWVDNVNLTTPDTITTPNTIITPIESLSNLASISNITTEPAPIIQNVLNNNSNNIIQSVTTIIEQNSDQINNVVNLISG
jgi:hypothetical protein